MTCLLFCEHLDNPMAKRNFSLDLYAFVMLKNLKFFSASCFVSFFHYLASSIFEKFT